MASSGVLDASSLAVAWPRRAAWPGLGAWPDRCSAGALPGLGAGRAEGVAARADVGDGRCRERAGAGDGRRSRATLGLDLARRCYRGRRRLSRGRRNVGEMRT